MACGQPPSQREGGSVWQIFTLEQLKSHSWNIRLEPPTHRSVGRLSALYHRLLLQLCKLRHNSPPQDRLHRSKVATLARANAQYTAPPTIRTIHTVAISLVFPSKWLTITTCKAGVTLSNPPLQTVLGVCQPPKTHRKRNSKKTIAPIMEKSARRSFSNGALFLALLCKPPLERITSHFVILPRQIAFFGLCIYH